MKLKRILILILIFGLFSFNFAQTTGLPKFKKGEKYQVVRVKLIKAGWKPFKSSDAQECNGDSRCVGRPEMESCAGTGKANCRFLWKRHGKTVVIFTVGENAVYDGWEKF